MYTARADGEQNMSSKNDIEFNDVKPTIKQRASS